MFAFRLLLLIFDIGLVFGWDCVADDRFLRGFFMMSTLSGTSDLDVWLLFVLVKGRCGALDSFTGSFLGLWKQAGTMRDAASCS